jgi:hypothetical protein
VANSGVVVVIAGQDNTDKVFKQIEANLERTQQRAHETESALNELGERGKRALETIGIAIGVREAVEGLKEMVKSSLEYGESINDAATKTGLTTQTLSVLSYAATQAGTDFEGVSSAVAKMDKTIAAAANGNKQAAATLSAIGLNASELANRTDGAEIAFKRVSQSIAATESPIRRVELATSLFGKSGADLIETLVNIGQNFDYYKQKTADSGKLLSPETAEQLEQMNKQFKGMQQKIQGAELAFTQGLLPGLQAVMNVISGGKGSRDTLIEWGQDVAKVMAFVAEVVYSAASAVEFLFSASEGGTLTDAGRRDIAAAKQLQAQAEEFHSIAFGPKREFQDQNPPTSPPKPGSGGAFGGAGDVAGQEKIEAAQKQRDAALLKLADQAQALRQQKARNEQDLALAQLNSDHKQQLVSDSDYYAQKLAVQNKAFDEQLAAAKSKMKDNADAIAKLQTDQRKKGAGTVEGIEDTGKIAELQAKRLQIEGEIAKIQTDAAKTRIESEHAIYDLQQKRLTTSDDLAAKVEAQHGLSVEARLKQNDDKYANERKGLVSNYGADSVEVGDADQIDKARRDTIVAQGAEASYGASSSSIEARRAGVAGAQARGLITSLDARRQSIELDREEAAALQPVLEAYRRLAEDDGDLAATQKVIDLQSRIQELNNPINDVAQHLRESLGGAFEGLFDNIASGRKALESFARDVERTLSDAIYKQYVQPNIERLLAAAIPNGPAGPGGPLGQLPNGQTAGNPGAVPKGISIGSVLGGLIPGLAKGPRGGGSSTKGTGMNITVTLVNDTDAQLKIGDIAKQGGSDLDKFEALFGQSFGNGGIVRQLLNGS